MQFVSSPGVPHRPTRLDDRNHSATDRQTNYAPKLNISTEIIVKLKQKIEIKLYPKIIKDTKTVTDWVYSVIKQVCEE